ncbi:MAG: Organic solvent tolerance protein OstA-like protein [Fibrobacteria bacterium]|jgi:hypothetical protein|nr:Organic solvent tolerance protein OstA-like protein [Fibrobacteria bacterium]
MSWRFSFILAAFAALPLFAQDLVRLPPPPVDSAALREAARADSLRAAAVDTLSDTVTYSAPRIRFRGDRFSLSGGALLKYKASTLRADSILYYSDEDVVDAFGAPTIEDPSNPSIIGYRMRYNLQNRVGTLYYGSSEKDGQTFNGIEVRRQVNSDIYIARGDLSTCDEKPEQHYYFYARRMIVEPESKVLSGPIVLNIADVPLAVLPMAVVPLGKGRRSGIIQPKFGGDQSQGYYLQNLGYYWALSDYHDFQATTNIIEGSEGTFQETNLNTLYQWNKRYVWSGMVGTQVFLPEFQPSQAAGILDFKNDLNLTPDGRQTLKGEGRLQSSANVARDNALNEQQALEQTANASLGYRRQFDWNQAVLNVGLLQNYNLTQEHIDRNIPDVSFAVSGPLIPESEDDPPLDGKEPWYRSWNWNYNNSLLVNQVIKPATGSTSGDSNTYSNYADQASLSGKYTLGYVNLTPSLNGSQLWSAGERTGNPADPSRNAVDPLGGGYGQYFAAWNASISADTRIYGITQAEDKPWNGLWLGHITAARHTITPTVSLTYAPEIDSNPAFLPNPKIGGTAYQAKQQTVGFGLSNDLDIKTVEPGGDTLKQKPVAEKVLAQNSSISYNFASEVRPWSDLSSSVTTYVFPVPLTLSASHRVYDDYADSAARNEETSPILQSWNFGWRWGRELGGGFSTGLRMRDTRGLPTDRFEHTAWSASFNYGIAIGAARVGTNGEGNAAERFVGTSEIFQVTKTHQASAGLKINPTREWKMSYDTEYNFTTGEFSRHAFGFERTLHCWQMVFHWNPVGVTSGWDFVIRIIDLPDIKLETRDSRSLR